MRAEFVSDAWNWFDVVVVLISLLSLAMPHLPGADILKLVRCFRVLRLCTRVHSFRNIIIGQQLDKRTSEEIEADDDFDFQKQALCHCTNLQGLFATR